LLACTGAAAQADTNYTDQWWNPTESGWGASVLQQRDTLFVEVFVYGAEGQPTWLTAAAVRQDSASNGHALYVGDLYEASGPYFGAPFQSAEVAGRPVGTLTFYAENAISATLRYSVDGTSVVKSVTRQTWSLENLSGSYLGGESGKLTGCGADDGLVESLAVIDIVHRADGSVTIALTDAQQRTRTIDGTYVQHGQLGFVYGTLVDSAGGWRAGVTLSEIQSTPSGITGRAHVVSQRSGPARACIQDTRWGGVRRGLDTTTYKGRVLHGRIANARVCGDINHNGRCDPGETQATTDANGGWQLGVQRDAATPLVVEVIAGVSRDSAQPGATIDASYRMTSPSAAYSTDITPLTTIVDLTRQMDLALAEDLARNEIGLPPKFDLRPASAPAQGSLVRAVEDALIVALKAAEPTLDPSSSGALADVVAAFPPALTTLPTLRISTRDGAPITSTESYIDATFALTNPMVSNAPMLLNGEIRGRGHTTWGLPKNPYRIKFANDNAYKALPEVAGMKKSRHWALLAEWFDRSLMRNKLALSLASSSVFADGLKWTPSGQHVEVYLNDDYVGVYLLTETIRIDKDRLALRTMSSDPSSDEVDGGYIVEVDRHILEGPPGLQCYANGLIDLLLVTPQGVPICVDTPDEESVTLAQLLYIKSTLVDIETDLYEANGIDRINQVSFADAYLVQELFRNNDAAFASSVYMWKDTDAAADPLDRLLNLGPLWDFDRAAGNINYNDNWKTDGCWVTTPFVGNWLSAMFDYPSFVQRTLERWHAKRRGLGTFIDASIATYARRLGAAQKRNFERWPILGMPLINYYTFDTFDGEVGFLQSFLDARLAWLDQAYASPASFGRLCR
jgi:hypothetical protein